MAAVPTLRLAVTCTLAALALAACGTSDAPGTPAATSTSTSASKSAKSGPARPEDELPKPKCPSSAGAKLPGPDIVGLKLGMSFDEALNHARCAMPDAVVGFAPRWFQQLQTGATTLEKQAFTIQRGDTSECVFRQLGDAAKCGLGRRVWDHVDEMISVATPGLNGRQKVVGVWRTQNWKVGEMPSRDTVRQALRDKYGPEGEFVDGQYARMNWRRDAAGAPLRAGDPTFEQCYGIAARAASPQGWREGCGLAISAEIVAPRDNPDLVESLHVGMAHHENLLNSGDAMQAELDRLDAERRRTEVKNASGAAPTL